jgi:catechol 2,3-dioxygenase-like lactoylglutathione lyase family enzyme
MILDMTFGTGDLSHAIKFYDAVLGCVGIDRAPDWPDGWAGWGDGYGKGSSIWLCPPFDGKQPTAGNGTMVTFFCQERQRRARLSRGGTCTWRQRRRRPRDPALL